MSSLNQRGFDLLFGLAFFVEVAAVDVVYDRNGDVFYLEDRIESNPGRRQECWLRKLLGQGGGLVNQGEVL